MLRDSPFRRTAPQGHIDLIVCSPLTRALKTANIAFEGTNIPRVVNADIRWVDHGHAPISKL